MLCDDFKAIKVLKLGYVLYLHTNALYLHQLLIHESLDLRLQQIHLQLHQSENGNDVGRRVGRHVQIDQRVHLLRVSRLRQQLILRQNVDRLLRLRHRLLHAGGHARPGHLAEYQPRGGAWYDPLHREELGRQGLQVQRGRTVPFRADGVVEGGCATMFAPNLVTVTTARNVQVDIPFPATSAVVARDLSAREGVTERQGHWIGIEGRR